MGDSPKSAEKLKGKLPGSARDVRKYTQQIWLAGLGAFSRSEEEGGKFFEALVKAGEEIENRTRDAAGMVEEVRDRMREKASGTFEKVERVFDDRITSALGRLGIPSQRDIDALNRRLDDLTSLLQQLATSSNNDRDTKAKE